MKKSIAVGIAFAVLAICQFSASGAENTQFEKIQSLEEYEKIVSEGMQESEGSVIDGMDADTIADYGLKRILVLTDVPPEDTYGADKAYRFERGNMYMLEYATEKETEDAYSKLQLACGEENVLLDRKISMGDQEESVEFTAENGDRALDRIGAALPDLWGIHLMGLDTLKTQAEGNWNEKVTVAVVDTGIDTDHPWFQGRISEDSISLVAGESYEDGTGHGTHVSGIVAQGTAANVKIMAIRLFNEDGDTTISLLLEAINYINEKKPDVVNMSLGQSTPPEWETAALESKFKEYIDSGGVICVSAGNDATFVSRAYPASSLNTITVSSITKSITEPVSYSFSNSFSNYGGLIDFTAPGEWIESAWIGGGTKSVRGTSMSCPHVSAAAAMVKVRYPDYNQEKVYEVLKEYAVDMGEAGKDDYYGYGYVNLADFYQNTYLENSFPEIPSKDPAGKEPVKDPANTLKAQTVFVPKTSYKKVYGDAVFLLDAKAEGKLTYLSSDPAVASVDEKGRVTIKGVGKADITISAASTTLYYSAEKKVSITVYPQKIKVKKANGAKNKIKISWKKLSYVTGYQIRYSLKKNMSSAKKVKVNGAGKVNRIISFLKSQKTYYMQIRGYKKLHGQTYYGSWSSLKTAKVK